MKSTVASKYPRTLSSSSGSSSGRSRNKITTASVWDANWSRVVNGMIPCCRAAVAWLVNPCWATPACSRILPPLPVLEWARNAHIEYHALPVDSKTMTPRFTIHLLFKIILGLASVVAAINLVWFVAPILGDPKVWRPLFAIVVVVVASAAWQQIRGRD